MESFCLVRDTRRLLRERLGTSEDLDGLAFRSTPALSHNHKEYVEN